MSRVKRDGSFTAISAKVPSEWVIYKQQNLKGMNWEKILEIGMNQLMKEKKDVAEKVSEIQ
jgi:hypothetical protein